MAVDKKRMNIGVFFGSRNPEHEVSIITGQMILSGLRKLGYAVVPVYISRDGRWFSDSRLGSLKRFTGQELDRAVEGMKPSSVGFDVRNGKLFLGNGGMFEKKTEIDLAFPAFHGRFGEDGSVQGLFELAGVPYVGCGVAASAISMDKILTKQFYGSVGIGTTPFTHFDAVEWVDDNATVRERIDGLRWPVFVKPARLGSSIGIAKVRNIGELNDACEVALHYDDRVIVEEAVEDVADMTCAVLGNGEPIASLVQEAVFHGDHFSYEAKYLEDGGAQLGSAENSLVIPAELDEATTERIRSMAIRIYKLLDCSGTARVDFLYDRKRGDVYANEVNTMPGTLYHHLWKASGIGFDELLEKLLNLALERSKNQKRLSSEFGSRILDFANSVKLRIDKG